MPLFWQVIVSAILSKKLYMYMCSVPNGFQDRAISLCSCKILIKKCFVLFIISVFIVQLTQSVHFTQHSACSNIPPSTSMHFAARVRTWRVAGLSSSWRTFMLAITSIVRSSNSSLSTNNSQLTLHTDSDTSYSGAVRRQRRTTYWAPDPNSLQWNISISETVRNRAHVPFPLFLLSFTDTMPPKILKFPPGTPCIFICTHTYIHTNIHTYIHKNIHTYKHTYTHTYKHTYIHTYKHTNIHTYKHTYTSSYTRLL
jgi:hypothetical protein